MTTLEAADETATVDHFVARQAIFTRRRDVHGYELLYRSGPENIYTAIDGTQATAELITGGALTLGWDRLVAGKLAFVNFTRNLLVSDYYTVLEPSRTVIELLEDIAPDDEVVEACRRLKSDGYGLALDDVTSLDGYGDLLDLADIVKVDLGPLSRAEWASIANELKQRPRPVRLLAEKVETREQFDEALALGYDYFQGYFMSRPVVLSGKEIPAFKLNLMELLYAVHRPDFDFGELEAIVKRDVSLSYKMLRFANAAAHGVRHRIESVKHALVMLGQEDVVRTVSLLVLAGLAADKSQDLAVRSMIRAMFCESLASEMNLHDEKLDHFLVGMFSMIDVILELPMADLVSRLPTSPQVNFALLGSLGPLREMLELVIAYENVDWPRAQILIHRLGVRQETVPPFYMEAVAAADDVFATAER